MDNECQQELPNVLSVSCRPIQQLHVPFTVISPRQDGDLSCLTASHACYTPPPGWSLRVATSTGAHIRDRILCALGKQVSNVRIPVFLPDSIFCQHTDELPTITSVMLFTPEPLIKRRSSGEPRCDSIYFADDAFVDGHGELDMLSLRTDHPCTSRCIMKFGIAHSEAVELGDTN